MQHANEAVDEERRAEFFRKGGRVRGLMRGKRWLLLSRWMNLTAVKRQELNQRFALNRKVFKAYLLKESFDCILNYCRTKIPLGVVEAVNGNVRSLLCRGRGYNLHYLLLKAQRMATTRTEFVVFKKSSLRCGHRRIPAESRNAGGLLLSLEPAGSGWGRPLPCRRQPEPPGNGYMTTDIGQMPTF
jgi:Transposase